MTKIFINGMGTIGRAVFRQAATDNRFQIVGVNDPKITIENMAYLLNYDSTGQGMNRSGNTVVAVSETEVKSAVGELQVGESENKIPVFNSYDVNGSISFVDLKADIVFDCTGTITKSSQAQVFIDNGARFVLVCNPVNDANSLIYGVNADSWSGSKIVSAGSCTLQAACVLLKVLDDDFTIVSAIVKSVHAYTADQQITEGADNDYPERGRAAAVNIVPTYTSAAKAIGKVIPILNGRVMGQAFRVPVLCGSAVDIAFELGKDTTVDAINKKFKESADDITLSYADQALVSSDIIGTTSTVTFLYGQTVMVNGTHGNIVGLYDNVNGYAYNALLTANYMVQGTARMMYEMYASAMPLSLTEEDAAAVPFEEFDWRTYYDSVKDDLMQADAEEEETNADDQT